MNQANFQADNPYASFGEIAIEAPATDRLAFMKRTYLHLALAIYALVTLEFIYFRVFEEQMDKWMPKLLGSYWMMLMFGGFMIAGYIANRWAQSETSVGMQYAGLLTYVLAQSVFLAPMLWIAEYYSLSLEVGGNRYNTIGAAALLTLLVFGVLTATVLLTRKDFSFLGPIISIASMLAFGLIIASFFFGFSLGILFSAAMVLVASGYVLYDTSNILHHYRTTQHVAASLALFASVALLFWYILQILISLSGRD